ncbi:MAG: DMT family transporter [Clostridia bacterium]|nr:DMT family transporter [Clostridia bacterium]
MTNQVRKGYGSVILASLAYGIMPVVSKVLLLSGMNSESVVFYRFFLTCLFSALILAVSGRFKAVTLLQAVTLALFGVLGFGLTMQFLTISYQYIPIGLATVLHFAYPLFVTVIMLAVYGEKPGPARLWGCAAALAGICLMVDLKGNFSLRGVVYALLSAVTYSAFVVSNKKASFGSLSPLLCLFTFSLAASLFFGSGCALTGTLQVPGSLSQWGCLLAVSLLCTVFAFCTLMTGVRILGAARASVINMLEPATGVILGVILFKETLSLKIMLGCACILVSTLITVLARDSRKDGGKKK